MTDRDLDDWLAMERIHEPAREEYREAPERRDDYTTEERLVASQVENAQLREQLAQAVTVLQLLYDQYKREMRSPQMTEVLRCLNQARKALADPDEKEKP